MVHHSKLEVSLASGSSPSSSSGGRHSSSRGHRHHHHRHRHASPTAKAPREPSVHSFSSASDLSSSELSSSSGASSVHHRSTPKIAAVIIAAIIVITGLIGVTVYLVDGGGGRMFSGGGAPANEEIAVVVDGENVEIVEERGGGGSGDPALDFQTYRDGSIMQKHVDSSPNLANHQSDGDATSGRFRHRPQHHNHGLGRDRKDPEGPMDISVYEDFYDEQDSNQLAEERLANGREEAISQRRFEGVNNGENGANDDSVQSSRGGHLRPLPPFSSAPPAPPRVSLTDGASRETASGGPADWRGRRRKKPESSAMMTAGFRGGDAAERPPYGARLEHEQGMPELADGDAKFRGPNGFRRRQYQMQQAMRARMGAVDGEGDFGGDLERPPLPPSGSRGGIHVPETAAAAEDEDYDEAVNQGKDRPVGITTLDRRPGRPPFHHMGPMGPPPSGPAFERRQKLMELRRRQSMLQRRLGMLAQQSEVRERVAPVSPVVEAKRMLRRFGGMVDLAKSEVAMIRDIARNITESGKEMNLWEMLSAVNASLHDHPDSPIGRLMNRFYSRYLSQEADLTPNGISAAPAVVSAHGRSVTSLLFLSFGIFLLNAVSVIARERGGPGLARSFDGGDGDDFRALQMLMVDGDELAGEAATTSGEEGVATEEAKNGGLSLNSYLRLVMNLMNAYSDGGESDLQCLWSLYCHRLNAQASAGGALSAVARLNSVGMRLVLHTLPGDRALGAAARAITSWEDVDCQAMFPQCEKDFRKETPE